MQRFCSIFSQLLQLFPRVAFQHAVVATHAERHARGFTCWGQFVAMLFCQLDRAHSLREICGGLASCEGKLAHLGIEAPSRTTLAYANAHRPWELYQHVFTDLLARCREVAGTHRFRFKNKLLSLDATVIDLCAEIFPWATFRRTKGAVKLHFTLDHDGCLPTWLDRGYIDFAWFARLTEMGVFFVTRMKDGTAYEVVQRQAIPTHGGILADEWIVLCSPQSAAKYEPGRPLRRVEVVLPDGTRLVFLTNHLALGPTTIARIYKDRWQIERFFKALKQNRRVKTFVGTSANALHIQVWTALIALLILKYLQLKATFGWSLSNLVALLRMNLFCATCGVRVEQVPWADGKHQLTTTYQWFLARWAKRLSWREVAQVFDTSWDQVFRAVEMAVAWGRAHVDLRGIAAIGIDEIQWQRGHRYLTLVYQIDVGRKRLLWIGQERRVKTLLTFFRWFGQDRTAALRFICSDMWKPYLKVVAKKAGHALHVLDRFHIAQHMGDAIDQVRRSEVHDLRRRGRQPWLTKARWILLKRHERRSSEERSRLAELVRHNLKAVRATLLREAFEPFWTYRSVDWAGAFLDEWCVQVMRSQIEPMKKVARMLRRHRPLLLNWFRARGQISAASVEGLNNKAKLTTRKAYGFRSYHCIEIALYHTLGQLPEPKVTHTFC